MNEARTLLMQKHADGALTAAEAATLAQAMAEDPAIAEQFAMMTRLESDLTSVIKEVSRTALYTRRMERAEAATAPLRKRPRRPLPVKKIAVAAGIAALAGTGWAGLRLLPAGKSGELANKVARPLPLPRSSGGHYAVLPADPPAKDGAALKRRLRKFFVPAMSLSGVPASQALAALEKLWNDNAGQSGESTGTGFVIADKTREAWLTDGSEPQVSLLMRDVSLLTNLELLAAQSGLKPVFSGNRVTLETDARLAETKERKWTIPLPAAAVTAFVSTASGTAGRFAGDVTRFDSFVETTPDANMQPAGRIAYWDDNGYSIPQRQPGQTATTFTGRTFFYPTEFDPPQIPQSSATDPPPAPPLLPVPREIASWTGLPVTDISIPVDSWHYWFEASPANTPQTVAFSANGGEIPANFEIKQPSSEPGALVANVETLNSFDVPAANPGTVTIDDLIAQAVNPPPERNVITRHVPSGLPAQAWGDVLLPWGTAAGFDFTHMTDPAVSGPETVKHLLAMHGVPTGSISWEPASDVLIARGTLREVNIAKAVAAAIEEAVASTSLTIEYRTIEWPEGMSPPRTQTLLPPASTFQVLTTQESQELIHEPQGVLRNVSHQSVRTGETVSVEDVFGPAGSKTGESTGRDTGDDDENDNGSAGDSVSLNISSLTRTAGDRVAISATFGLKNVTGIDRSSGAPMPVTARRNINGSAEATEGTWMRTDFQPEGSARAATVLFRLTTTSAP